MSVCERTSLLYRLGKLQHPVRVQLSECVVELLKDSTIIYVSHNKKISIERNTLKLFQLPILCDQPYIWNSPQIYLSWSHTISPPSVL